MISGNDAMKHIQAPFYFYWRPRKTNFEGIDAVIRFGNNAHRAATNDLTEVYKIMNWKRDVTWYLVMVGSAAEEGRNLVREICDYKWSVVLSAERLISKEVDQNEKF